RDRAAARRCQDGLQRGVPAHVHGQASALHGLPRRLLLLARVPASRVARAQALVHASAAVSRRGHLHVLRRAALREPSQFDNIRFSVTREVSWNRARSACMSSARASQAPAPAAVAAAATSRETELVRRYVMGRVSETCNLVIENYASFFSLVH